MSWFKKHLDWTLFIVGAIATTLFVFVIIEGYDFFAYLIHLGILLPTCFWYLDQKGRSLWWLLLIFITPIGWIFICGLTNKGYLTKPDNPSRIKCLDYYRKDTVIKLNHDQINEKYNNFISSMLGENITSSFGTNKIDKALELTTSFISEINNILIKRSLLTPLPPEVMPHYLAWQQAINAELSWAKSVEAIYLLMAQGEAPYYKNTIRLRSELDQLVKLAEKQDVLLLKRLNLTPEEVRLLTSPL